MFKKVLLAATAIVAVSTAASAKDVYTHDVTMLPVAAQITIADNFTSGVSMIKIDKDFGHISDYEVTMSDGTEISFDRNGVWDNVDAKKQGTVPPALVPEIISDYIKANQSGQSVVSIDRDRSGYEVELSNGVEIKFSRQGKFMHYDD